MTNCLKNDCKQPCEYLSRTKPLSMYKRTLLPIFLVLITCCSLSAQKEFKLGKIDKADLAMTELPSDTSAGAYVLHHSSILFFNLSDAPVMVQTVNRRVKLFKRSGFNEADVEIYYSPRYETLTSFKAQIHLPDGKTIKLRGKDFIREDYTDERKLLKFTFPQVTEGAIIEYTYRKTSERYTFLPRFYFQEDIPVRWAQYKADIPEYFRYVSLSNTHDRWAESKVSVENRFVGDQDIRVQVLRYAKADMPAFKDQPYTNNLTDYLPKIYMQLQSIVVPGRVKEDIISSWSNLAKDLADFEWFGRKFNNKADVKKPLQELEGLLTGATTETEKAMIAYRFIGQRMDWNKRYGIGSDDRLNQCWDKKTGNSAEINMLLLGVLKSLGIKAEPLLVSLRNRGAHIMVYPVFDQFDHLMVLAELDGKSMILDVNDTNRPMGLPRFTALNGQGWVASPENPRWIEVNTPKVTRTILTEIDLDEEGLANVAAQTKVSSYYALNARNSLQNLEDDNEGPLMREIVDVFPEAEFVSRELPEEDDYNGPFSFSMVAKVPLAQVADDYIYMNPVVMYALDGGLVDTEERFAPVDLGYPKRFRYVSKITIPEGYALEEASENVRMRSEDGSVVVSFATSATDEVVSLSFLIDISKAVFSAEEYNVLKEIFERAIELQESMIVFRKSE